MKSFDKKTYTPKAILDSIKSKHEEQRRQQLHTKIPKHQFAYHLDDREVITDVLKIMVLYISISPQHNPAERRRIMEFFEKFVSSFFGIPTEVITECLANVDRANPDDEFVIFLRQLFQYANGILGMKMLPRS